ncbi:MAG: hypothetical protein GC131_00910 [Alphaproteobacteria bacterium]|nr:hypothetical protein [Alphaproteobacteria bacterium]
MKQTYLIAAVVVMAGMISTALPAQEYPANAFNRRAMNDIRFDDYKGFEKDWKLVTVTFRTDIGEQRFAFANELAYKTLLSGQTDYPDGAVFGKVGVAVAGDAAFKDSKVPSGASRYQIMVRNKEKYADTGGWGYAIFNADGLVLTKSPEDTDKGMAGLCYECHKLVTDRGYVFSRPLDLSPDNYLAVQKELGILSPEYDFIDSDVSKLPPWVVRQLPEDTKKVRYLKSDLRKLVFSGPLVEIIPVLEAEAVRSNMPAIVIGDNKEVFGAYINKDEPLADEPACQEGQKPFVTFWSLEMTGMGMGRSHSCRF